MSGDPRFDESGRPIDASRRSFLATGAAVAGAAALGMNARAGTTRLAPPVKPTVKPGRVNPPKPDETIRMAVIGSGGMGRGHASAFCTFAQSGIANVEVVAFADVAIPHAEEGKKIADETFNNDAAVYQDYRELLARDDIHAVLIASPEHWHAQHAIDALVAGKDVYCEKPMTLDLDQAMDLRRVVLDHPDQIFQVGTQMMMIPKYGKAREAIKAGRIGKPVWSQTSYCRNSLDGEWNYYALGTGGRPGKGLDWDGWCGYLGPRPYDEKVFARWRRYRDFSTGIIGDLLVHVMTPLIYATDQGWPTRVVATGGHYVDKAMENHDQVNLQAQFEAGHTMIVAGSTCNEVGLETLVRGHEANLYLNGRHVVLRPERLYVDEIDADEIKCEDIGNDQDALRLNWLESIHSREPAISNIDLATKVMVIVDLASRSMWTGQAYTFDPDDMRAIPV